MGYEVIIGFEIHAQLLTKSKMFCRCDANYASSPPNTLICPICTGLPGSLPVPNEAAVDYALMTALALNCHIELFSKWDRKNYFYPDLPKGYQISQYDMPFSTNGWITIVKSSKETKRIGIRRAHLEEDTAKLYHVGDRSAEEYSLVDFNRAGVPLLEIVSEPDIASAEEAKAYVKAVRDVLVCLGVCSGRLEQGALRCEANVSLRQRGSTEFGTKVEVKNMNSFRSVELAVAYEMDRQAKILNRGGVIAQETRGWSEKQRATVEQRSKEEAHEYRYFPEPDIPPIVVQPAHVDKLMQMLPEMPDKKRVRFVQQYELQGSDANLIAGDKYMADFFEAAVSLGANPRLVSNWLVGEISYLLNKKGIGIEESRIRPNHLAELIEYLGKSKINRPTAKAVLETVFETGRPPSEIISSADLGQISSSDELNSVVSSVLRDHTQVVEEYQVGKRQVIDFLVGQVMKTTKGKADPVAVKALLEKSLAASST